MQMETDTISNVIDLFMEQANAAATFALLNNPMTDIVDKGLHHSNGSMDNWHSQEKDGCFNMLEGFVGQVRLFAN
jgi:hypothetical protein